MDLHEDVFAKFLKIFLTETIIQEKGENNIFMNVLMIAQYFPPDFGGASTRAYNAARGLLLQGCNVTVISAFPHYPHGNIPAKYRRKMLTIEELDGIKLIRTWIPRLPHSTVARRVLLHTSFILSSFLGLFLVRDVDIIFAMNPNLFAFFSALFYKMMLRKNIIRNVDDLWPEVFYELGIVKSRLAKKILDSLARISYQVPVAIIPVSNGYVETLTKKYKIPTKKIFVIEHGVDIIKFQDKKKTTDKKIIMYSGAIGVGYDFETVIKSAKILESQPVHFIIRGVGELEENIQHMIKEYEVSNVDLRTEIVPHQELISILATADIFILPMAAGPADMGFPTKILEYQSMGKPIACISVGESARYIKETKSGLVTSSRNPEEFARLIIQLVHDSELSTQLGTNGINHVKNNLTLPAVGKRMMDVITKSCSIS